MKTLLAALVAFAPIASSFSSWAQTPSSALENVQEAPDNSQGLSDGIIAEFDDFRAELDLRCKTGKPPKRNSIGHYWACALLVYKPEERGPGVRDIVFRPIYAVEKNGKFAWASWEEKQYGKVSLEILYEPVEFADIRPDSAKRGVSHLYFPVGLIGREENDRCKCFTFPRRDNPFGPICMQCLVLP